MYTEFYWCKIISFLQVTQRSHAVHDRAVINCQFSMAAFSTSERRRGGRDRYCVVINHRQQTTVTVMFISLFVYFIVHRRAIDLSRSLKEIFESTIMTESYPQSEININVQVLQSDGGKHMVYPNFNWKNCTQDVHVHSMIKTLHDWHGFFPEFFFVIIVWFFFLIYLFIYFLCCL